MCVFDRIESVAPVSWGKVCPGCISETIKCRKLILGGTLVRGCRCAMSWCDLDLTLP